MHHNVLLVPGFLGFSSIGGIDYFNGVRPILERHFERLGHEVTIQQAPTLPTASIRHRAARVLEALNAIAREHDGPIHLVGHSTGGLDARLAIAPTASLPSKSDVNAYDRVESLVTVSTPHYGTPLASFIGGAMGKPAIRALAIVIVFSLRQGRIPMSVMLKAGAWWNRIDDLVGLDDTVLDRMYADLLGDFSDERRRQIVEIIEQVSADQSLVFQLTPAGCDLLNAGTGDPEGVRYGCVLTRARPFGLRPFIEHRHDPYAQSLHLLFRAAYFVTSRATEAHVAPLNDARRAALEQAYGHVPELSDNDGIVPTLSQLWGDVVHAASGDHLDVVGHFKSSPGERGRADFLPSASGFDETAFGKLWGDIVSFVTDTRAKRTVAVQRGDDGVVARA